MVGTSVKRARPHSTIALAALEQLIKLADRAQIPLIGGGFAVAVELIQTCHVRGGTWSIVHGC